MVAAERARFGDLRVRLLTSLAAAALAFACVWFGGLPMAALVVAAAALMVVELRRITGTGNRSDALVWFAGGVAYVAVAALAFLWLRAQEPYGFLSILWAALVVVSTDVGGYFAGRTFGGPKLWPRVSPKKTWSGLAGGVGLAAIVGAIFSWATTGTYFWEVCTVSAAAAVLSQAGDMGESALKRHFGVKDAGRLLPGHGGLLDRLDGHMAAVMVAAAVTAVRGGQAVFIW